MKSIHIILRTCAPAKKSSYGGDRPFNLSKEEIILKSLKSLLESSKGYEKRIFMDLIDDSSPEEFRGKLESLLKKYSVDYNINRVSVKSNGKSAEFAWKVAEKSNHDLLYFLEDDYFHLKSFFEEIFYAYDNKIIYTDEFAIHPTDYPDRYVHLNPSYIFLGKNLHWRSVFHSTGTFIIPRKFFNKHIKFFYKFSEFNKASTGGEEVSFNKIWEKVPLISPLPSLAAHLNVDTLPPFIDWEKEIRKTKI